MYEYELYVEARKELPKRGTRVVTPGGEGKVVDALPLKQMVVVRLDDESKTRAEFSLDEIGPKEEIEALRQKAQEPCEKHKDGNCDCHKKKPRRRKK
jgi:cell fate regulator YaaT (PSP1 superfamily)